MPDSAKLIDSTGLLRDPAEMRGRMEGDGYLFFPGWWTRTGPPR